MEKRPVGLRKSVRLATKNEIKSKCKCAFTSHCDKTSAWNVSLSVEVACAVG